MSSLYRESLYMPIHTCIYNVHVHVVIWYVHVHVYIYIYISFREHMKPLKDTEKGQLYIHYLY